MLAVFDIGGTRIRAAVSDSAGMVAGLGEAATPLHDFAAFTATLARFVPQGARGVAISIAGCVDPDTGHIRIANIPCLDGRSLAADLSVGLGLPVWIGNDADCFALAEAGSGAGQGHRNVFGIILGTGVGGGLVIDGRIVTGAGGFAGEWGHGPVADSRPLGRDVPRFRCGCGLVGCLDAVGSARGMEKLHLHLSGQQASSIAIVAAWQDGDSNAAETVAVWTEIMAGPLAMVLNVVGASIVPVGGGLSNAQPLIAGLDAAVRARVLRRCTDPVVVPARHRIEPGLIGASLAGWGALPC